MLTDEEKDKLEERQRRLKEQEEYWVRVFYASDYKTQSWCQGGAPKWYTYHGSRRI